MKIEQYDKVLLRDGNYAVIVEIFERGKVFIADIDKKDGTETEWIKAEDVESKVEYETSDA